jgi:hypothetical protein
LLHESLEFGRIRVEHLNFSLTTLNEF